MKNLENEYKDLVNQNVPDLWDRIEKGIDSLEEIPNDESNIISLDNKKQKSNILKYMPIISSAAVLVIVAGVYMINRSGINRVSEATSYAADAEAASEAYEEVSARAFDEAAEYEVSEETEATEEATYEDSAPAVNGVSFEDEVQATKDMVTESAESVNEFTGYISACDNEAFIKISLDDGSELIILVGDDFTDIISEAISNDTEISFVYESLDEEKRSELPEGYEDVRYIITNLK